MNYENVNFTLFERFLIQINVIAKYMIELSIKPTLSAGLYSSSIDELFNYYKIVISLLMHIVIIWFAIRFYKKGYVFGFGLLFFYTMHSLESTIIPIENYFLHRNYLPSVGLYLAIVDMILILLKRYSSSVRVSFFCSYVVYFSFISYIKSDIWSSKENILRAGYKIYPSSSRVISDYSQLLFESRNYEAALKVISDFI